MLNPTAAQLTPKLIELVDPVDLDDYQCTPNDKTTEGQRHLPPVRPRRKRLPTSTSNKYAIVAVARNAK